MKKMTFNELRNLFYKHNASTEYPETLHAVIVFSEDSWSKEYSLENRSYKVKSNNWGWMADKAGRAIYGDTLDDTEKYIRLDRYIKGLRSETGWIVDYCYLLESN